MSARGVWLKATALTALSATLVSACTLNPGSAVQEVWRSGRASTVNLARGGQQTVVDDTVIPISSAPGSAENAQGALSSSNQSVAEATRGATTPLPSPGKMKLPNLRLQNGQFINGSDALEYLAALGSAGDQGPTFGGAGSSGTANVSLTLAELLTSPGSLHYDTSLGRFVSNTSATGSFPGISGALYGAGGNTAGQTGASSEGAPLVGLDGATLVGLDGATLVGLDGATLIGLDGATLIGLDGSTLTNGSRPDVAGPGGSSLTPDRAVLVGYPYFAAPLAGAKYRLTANERQGAPVAPLQRFTAGDVSEVLLPGQTVVRALTLKGEALTNWAVTGSSGAFVLPLPNQLPPVFFLVAQARVAGAPVLQSLGLAFSAGSERRPMLVPLDSASSMVTGDILFVLDYAPKEIARLRGKLEQWRPNSPRRPKALARIAELQEALDTLNVLFYAEDLVTAEVSQDQEDAEALNRAKALRELVEISTKARKKKNGSKPKGYKLIPPDSSPEFDQPDTADLEVGTAAE